MQKKWLRWLHFGSTGWFVFAILFMLIIALRQAGVNWLVIFSLSGYSVVTAILLVSLYLFAVFKGVNRSSTLIQEHPLTNSVVYLVFYDACPLLGALAGLAAFTNLDNFLQGLVYVCLGTFSVTFAVWIIIDPLLSVAEGMLPETRKHKQQRLEQARQQKMLLQKQKQQMIEELSEKAALRLQQWQKEFEPDAEVLASLAFSAKTGDFAAESEIVNLGLKAWQKGGLECMNCLREMAINKYRAKFGSVSQYDYISSFWNGVGHWRTGIN